MSKAKGSRIERKARREYPLAPHPIFFTLQGEGYLRGTPMVFVRLAGCSIGCPQCDTDYSVSSRASCEDIVERVNNISPRWCHWVWITGGEPTDHDLAPLVDVLRTTGKLVALATSGVRRIEVDVDWLSVSPHTRGFRQRHGDEVKIVFGLNGLSEITFDECAGFPHRYVMPLSGSRESTDEAVRFVLQHPGFTLTDQGHKHWGMP